LVTNIVTSAVVEEKSGVGTEEIDYNYLSTDPQWRLLSGTASEFLPEIRTVAIVQKLLKDTCLRSQRRKFSSSTAEN
jgi:hypothetical protein